MSQDDCDDELDSLIKVHLDGEFMRTVVDSAFRVSSESRLGVLLEYFDAIVHDVIENDIDSDGIQYAGGIIWPIFLHTWSACDDTWHHRGELLTLLRRIKEDRFDSFTDEPRRAYDALPSRVRIYRGCSQERVFGLSWSLSKDVAATFARGHRGKRVSDAVIATTTIKKSDVFAVLDDREEQEVLIDPNGIRSVKLEPLA